MRQKEGLWMNFSLLCQFPLVMLVLILGIRVNNGLITSNHKLEIQSGVVNCPPGGTWEFEPQYLLCILHSPPLEILGTPIYGLYVRYVCVCMV